MKQANVKATHYFREANDVADHLVKLAMNSQKNSSFDSFQHLPARAKGPFYLDKVLAFFIGSPKLEWILKHWNGQLNPYLRREVPLGVNYFLTKVTLNSRPLD
ncbi:hypothetical protein H5410_053612 [Solanum commersonii]|uniref:Uncharacterized protein n=1 Tax=Solanum commersonii TaxID=4109 RepID=A0A9J5X3Z1_SOLCO|nr:hypothetical protein H5410_053612 [Solanum commersonii]